MAGYLTTHVLDTALGRPAAGLRIALYRVSGNSHRKIAEQETNADGRTETTILPEAKFKTGIYELIFFAGEYLDRVGAPGGDVGGETVGGTDGAPRFLDQIPIRFGMGEDAHYHVPLLLSPFGYSTYRGS